MCSNKTKFGSKCQKDCSCKNGICNSGVRGDGSCLPYTCKVGYYGKNCETFEKSCNKNCSAHSHCVVDNSTPACKCNPGYSGNGLVCKEIDPCKDVSNVKVQCQKNTVCKKTGPGRHKCVCSQGYTGDGVICSAIDHCQRNHGNCPNNTRCNYLGPGQFICSCLAGYSNYNKTTGCTITDLCVPSQDCLFANSECVMTAPNLKECKCRKGYVGNGTVCYGNILQRIDDLHSFGPHKNKLRHVKNIIKRHPDLTLAFTERGPFTVFVPTDNGLERKFTPKELSDIIRNKKLVHDLILVHSARAYLSLSSFEKNGELTTLKGWNAVVNSTVPCYHLIGRSEKPSILTHDILASNGIIHVIDEPAWKPDFGKFANISLAQQDNRTLWEIIVQRSELQNFRDYIQIAGMQHEFEKASANGSTVIAPVNESFSVLDQMDREFLNSSMEGKAKLRAIIRHHIFGLKIGVIDLSYQSSLTSKAPEFVNVSVLDRGAVLLAGKSKLIDNNVLASNGFIHITSALLIPSFVLPIVPRHCDKNSATVYSKCRPCALKFVNGNCPTGFVSTGKNDVKCSYTIDLFIVRRIVQGCKTECKPQIRKCCSGFYGPDCSPCPGPVGLPCFGNGECFDGVGGNGRCKCKNNFKGTACELCKNNKKFGLDCTKTCTCVHGTCEGGIYGSGSCRPGTCLTGYSGKECALHPKGCSGGRVPILRHCSVHALCFVRGGKATCECNTGYEKIGNDCYEIDPCLQKNRGGCDKNAFCTKTGPGKNKCICSAGWTGDGYYCTPINYCAMQSRGHCHGNAKCTFLGPAQARCDCLIGYEGDGTSCKEINTCLKNNGGCSPLAKCIKTGPGQNRCTCRLGYIGNGFICVGSLAVAVKRQRELTTMSALIVKYNLDRFLADPRKNITVFLPSNAAISNLNAESRKILDIPANLFVFGGANIAIGAYFSSQLRNITRLQALFKDVNIIINHTKSGEPLIGGSAKIVTSNITASNGVLHVVDKVLLPSFVKKPRIEPSVYEGLCGDKNRFQQMCRFIKKFQLEDEIKNCTHCTIFVPTDEAFHELSYDRHHNISRVDILYHMTNHFIDARTVLNGQQFTTLAGNIYKLYLEKGKKTKQVIVNGITAAYSTSNSTWIIYTTGRVLKAMQNYCYRNLTVVFRTQCRPCQFGTLRCRPGLSFAGRQDCYYRAFGSVFLGCRALCSRPYKIRRCCPGFWGKDCTACPGENNNPCFGNGKCHDSTTGNGHCECQENFSGVACERCKAGYFGKYCKPCNCFGKATCDREYGFCLCPDNKRGLRCDQEVENMKCGNVTCHKHASCMSGTCQCDYGFTGNGTICKHTKFCEINNGGCSPDAKCDIIANTAKPNCSCKTNFEGDGYYCRGRNACSKEPCLERAKCFYARPGRANCICNPGYTGDGKNSCELINPCDQDNGGCSFNAKCTFNSTTLKTTCSCSDGYTGDGYTCVGNILETLQNDANLAEFYSRLKKSTIKDVLSPENHVSVIAPANNAFKSSRRQRRSVKTLSDSDLKYYIISCVALSENDVNTADLSFVTVAGSWLNITSPKVINNQVKVLSVKSVTNSAILVVDRLLDVPQQAQLKNRTMTEVAKDRGYGTFIQLLTAAGLDITSNIYSQPYTMFWPSNDAISRLPEDIKKRLLDANYKSELIDVLNYHIIQKTKITTIDVLTYSGGLFRRSREGSPLYISCKGHKGDLFINDRSKIIERDIEYQEGIAYGISEVLLPPGVAGRCDEVKYEAVKGDCTACADNGFCPPGTILESVDKNASCKFQGQYFGCLSRCVKRTKVVKCCKNFYGADCQACPGDVGNPCNGQGSCDDGISGTGNCSCNKPFIGRSCESCSNPEPECRIIHTNLCTSRMNPCSIFATCVTGRNPLCKCFPNYEGKGYYCQAIDKCQKNNGGCSKHALCRYLGPNRTHCECRSGYIGDGYTCTALSPQHPCATNNGNCDVHAGCFDESGDASCRCRDGFIGNGKVCAGSTKDVINDIEDLSEFAKAIKKLSFGVEGNDIIRRLSSEKDHTVFAPINYGFTLKSMTINDLKNHIVEGKLSFKTGQTVYSLARNKITIVVSKNNSVRLNNIASVVSDYPATNGIVVVIDHIIPYKKPLPTPQPTTTETPTSKTSNFNTTVHEGSVNSSSEKKKLGLIIGVVFGGLVVVVLIILAICFYKRRHHPKIKYNKNFESIMFESEAYADDRADDDDEYEHQALQHPSSEGEGTTVNNPTYVPTDEDITAELLEMTESSSIVPLTERNVISSAEKEEKC